MRFPLIVGCLVVLTAILFWNAARWLIVDSPARSDVILVLDGSIDGRFAKGLRLLQDGYGKEVIVAENVDRLVFGRTRADLAHEFIQGSAGNIANRIDVCSTRGDSVDSVQYVARCISSLDARSILLVTSDYETRRTLSMFSRFLPQYHWSVAAAEDPSNFGRHWWKHRAWAKRTVRELSELLWWDGVDRWRNP
jgi:uncharacterized SAM-binding protein YcdF (DUF218 family)